MREAEHGGDLSAIARRYAIPRSRLVDFSANVNPLGPPAALVRAFSRAARDRAELARYPDGEHGGLVRALAEKHAIDAECIVVANGAAAVLDAAVRVRRLQRCLVPEPAFSEDRRALSSAGVAALPLQLYAASGFRFDPNVAIETMRRTSCDALLVTNPHNPSGAVVPRADVVATIREVAALGALSIVDEAFVDYVPEHTIVDVAAREPATIVIRSLTKFFAVPALRVGYAVCEPQLARTLRAVLPPWPVTPAAARALVAALADRGYERRTIARNRGERERLARRLRALGFGVVDGAANFLLVEIPATRPAATAFVAELIVRAGIVLRDCTSYPGIGSDRLVRVAVRGRRDNDRLLSALRRAGPRDGRTVLR